MARHLPDSAPLLGLFVYVHIESPYMVRAAPNRALEVRPNPPKPVTEDIQTCVVMPSMGSCVAAREGGRALLGIYSKNYF